ncbi:hypothetical protein AAY473_001796 [Plecturocebus cupreus]
MLKMVYIDIDRLRYLRMKLVHQCSLNKYEEKGEHSSPPDLGTGISSKCPGDAEAAALVSSGAFYVPFNTTGPIMSLFKALFPIADDVVSGKSTAVSIILSTQTPNNRNKFLLSHSSTASNGKLCPGSSSPYGPLVQTITRVALPVPRRIQRDIKSLISDLYDMVQPSLEIIFMKHFVVKIKVWGGEVQDGRIGAAQDCSSQ